MIKQKLNTPRPNTLDVITMGCSKNLVDSERLMRMFADAGFETRHNPEIPHAQLVVINTCGFIGDAKQESIDMILECLEAKKEGRIGHLTVMGCLAERYRKELPAELPEVDRWYGKFDWPALLQDVTGKDSVKVRPWERQLTTGPHFAYVKIAEGCDRFCGFCAIPLITGRMHSRPIDEIADEVRALVAGGTREFNIIAQDLSSYGKDLYGHKALAELVQTLADIPGVEWLRLHYAYPSDFPYDILPVMARNDNVCKYLDIALQHVSDNVLKNMRRHINGDETRQLLERIRREVPGIHIRTTLMTGYPGEGDKEFAELFDFVREQRFERMGAFAYCEEEDTYAARNLKDEVPQDVKEERLSQLMELQEQISLELHEQKVGQTLRVVCDSEDDEFFVCRSEFDSPEVDPEILVSKAEAPYPLRRGEFYNVIVREALPFDLIAEISQDK